MPNRKAEVCPSFFTCILFHETRAIAHAHAGTHASKFMRAMYHICKITFESTFTFVLLSLYISRKEKFFIEHFIHEI